MTTVPAHEGAFGRIPRIHYAPRRNWLNDPNGLVFHEGRYHLFFQYNPEGCDHGNMSWGHASSTDLVTWEEHPVALRHDAEQEIYSGSAVWDEQGTAGFGPALIALYTAHRRDRRHQAQSLAYSHDDGLTWTHHDGNPVLDRDSGDFRDPKVMRYRGEAGEYWVMSAVEAAARQVVFYRSENLRDWSLLSEFAAPEVGDGIWECPDLFPLMLDGEEKWVLIISLGMAPVVSGFGTIYFVGSFDGTTFVPEGDYRLLDHGRDNYAGVTFFGLPDDQRTLIAWMNNWIYARELPVIEDEPRRGAMTLGRRLSLADVDGNAVLRQEPVMTDCVVVSEQPGMQTEDRIRVPVSLPDCCRLEIDLDLGEAAGARIRFRHGDRADSGVVLNYDVSTGDLRLERAAVGPEFPSSFHASQSAPTQGKPRLTLTLWTDINSVEIFADGGLVSLTSLVGPSDGDGLTVEGIGGQVTFDVKISVPEQSNGR